ENLIGQIEIDSLENAVFNRLEIYEEIEKKTLQNIAKKSIANQITGLISINQDSKSDFVSHMILRLGHCKQFFIKILKFDENDKFLREATRKIFLRAEEIIFMSRFHSSSEFEQQKFIKENDINYQIISKEKIEKLLRTNRFSENNFESKNENFYSV
ncbi:DNA primase subunit pri2, partial [Bonamia ostreae]